MPINTKHIDDKIAYMDSVMNDKQMSKRTHALALSKKTLLLQERAELLHKGMLSRINEVSYPSVW